MRYMVTSTRVDKTNQRNEACRRTAVAVAAAFLLQVPAWQANRLGRAMPTPLHVSGPRTTPKAAPSLAGVVVGPAFPGRTFSSYNGSCAHNNNKQVNGTGPDLLLISEGSLHLSSRAAYR